VSHEPKADWFSVSTRLLRDRKVQALIREHGHEVSSTVIALFAQARLQKKAGEVDTSWYDLAKDALTTEEKVQAVVAGAHDRGFVVVDEQDEDGVILHFPAWKRHQNTASQQRSREARKPASQANVIDGHSMSPNVVLQDITGQDKTEQEKTEEKNKELVPLTRSNFPLSFLIADLRTAADPDGKVYEPTRTWAVEEERMLRIDGRDPVKAETLIRWTWAENNFWRGKVGSTKKFRSKYQQLHEDAVKDWKKNGGAKVASVSVLPSHVEVTGRASAAWTEARSLLRDSLPEGTYTSWIDPVLCAGESGDVLCLSARDAVATWVDRRYKPLILKALAETSDFKEIRIGVELDEDRRLVA